MKQEQLYIGLMSGTSVDSIDAVALQLEPIIPAPRDNACDTEVNLDTADETTRAMAADWFILDERTGNVLGLMPHPERASDPLLGGIDGQRLLQALLG